MPLNLREQLAKRDFYEGFDTTTKPHFTLLCFLLKQNNKILYDLWGYAINNLQGSHAEELVINIMENYLVENISPNAEYTVTYYLSYNPCANCCCRIIDFHKKFRNKINMNIKVSREYYLKHSTVQRSLRDLLKRDISFKVMDRKDFAECFYLFVEDGHTAAFEPWPDLDIYYESFSKQLAILFNLPSEEADADGEDRNIVNPDGVCCSAEACQSAAHHRQDCKLHHAPYLTPKKNVSGVESTPQFHTPQKVNPSDNRQGVGARRKLF